MPRKKIDGAVTGNKPKMSFAQILAFFAVASLEIADFTLEAITDVVKQRHAKGKAVLAGRAKGAVAGVSANEAVDAATKSALAPVKEKKKPGPAKGSKRKAAGSGAQAESANGAAGSASGNAGDEITDASSLPAQEGVLDLDAK